MENREHPKYMGNGVEALFGLLLLAIMLMAISKVAQFFQQTPPTTTKAEIICNSPFIRYGDACCLDENHNSICDTLELSKTQQTRPTTIPTTTQPTKYADVRINVTSWKFQSLQYQYGAVWVDGNILNVGNYRAYNVEIKCYAYDDNNECIGGPTTFHKYYDEIGTNQLVNFQVYVTLSAGHFQNATCTVAYTIDRHQYPS